MKNLFISLITIPLMISCLTQSGNTNISDSIPTDEHVDTTAQSTDSVKIVGLRNGTSCFACTKNQDTIFMQLTLRDSVATGDLIYNLYEKDKNKGTFKGFMKGDTLLANYSFSSEGLQSMRQVIFLLKGNIFLCGSGSMKGQGNEMVFSNKKDITFNTTLVLKPVDCEELAFKKQVSEVPL